MYFFKKNLLPTLSSSFVCLFLKVHHFCFASASLYYVMNTCPHTLPHTFFPPFLYLKKKNSHMRDTKIDLLCCGWGHRNNERAFSQKAAKKQKSSRWLHWEREEEGEALSTPPGSGSTCTPTQIAFRPTRSCNHGNRVVILVDRLWPACPRPGLKEKDQGGQRRTKSVNIYFVKPDGWNNAHNPLGCMSKPWLHPSSTLAPPTPPHANSGAGTPLLHCICITLMTT